MTFGRRGLALFTLLAFSCGQSERRGDEGRPRHTVGGASNHNGAPIESPGGAPDGDPRGGAPSEAGSPHDTSGAPAVGGAGAPPAEEPPLPSPVCDDGNACTQDTFAAGACRHIAASDSTPCDDGNLCSIGDHCVAGVCTPRGTLDGPARMLGGLESYGTGLSLALGNGRFGFVDAPALPARLTLAEVMNGVLTTGERVDVDPLLRGAIVGTVWDDTIALADGSSSVELNGSPRYFQLFSLSDDGAVEPHGPVPLTPGSDITPVTSSLAGRGSSLFVCTNFGFFGPVSGTLMWWDVADPDAPVLLAQGSTGGQCGSIAVSEDGKRVYVNTSNGVVWTDLTIALGGDLVFYGAELASEDAALQIVGDRLLARSGDLLRIYDEPRRTLLGSFTVPGANAAAFTESGIFVQRDVPSGSGTQNYVALYDDRGKLIQELPTLRYDYPRDVGSAKPVVDSRYALDTWTHRMFSLSSLGLLELEAPELGPMSWPFAETDTLHVRGVLTAHAIDVSDPLRPRIIAGGPSRQPAAGIGLDVSLAPAELVPETDPNVAYFFNFDPASVAVDTFYGHTASTRVQSFAVDVQEHFSRRGDFSLVGGNAQLRSEGGFLYRTAYDPKGGVVLQRFAISDLRGGATEPVLELAFPAPVGTARSTQVYLDVDVRARTAALTTAWSENQTAVSKLYWIDLVTGRSSSAETLPSPVRDLRLQRDTILYTRVSATNQSELVLRRRGHDAEQVFELDDRPLRLLAFDGRLGYVSMRDSVQAVSFGDPSAPALVADFPTRGAPIALSETATSLAVTTPGGLLTLSPACQ